MIINGESLEQLKLMEENSIDHIITDPPYLIDFMGKKWDSADNIAGSVEFWKEALRVCKSGSYALVFGHSRTHHRVMVALENAGWEIRDCLMWLQGQGFPKSHELGAKIDKALGHIGHRGKRVKHQHGHEHLEKPEAIGKHEPISAEAKEWSGWGENLKPAYEPIIMARKPFKGSLTNNVLINKTGALNIDACKVNERHPANVILDEETTELLDQQDTKTDGVSRFFYCPKVSSKERNFGCEELPQRQTIGGGGTETDIAGAYGSVKAKGGNHHPTLKPIELMKYLVKLVSKEGQTILDPFTGSGSTGIAVELLNRNFIGVELDPDYCEIAEKRISAWKEKENKTLDEHSES